MLILILCWSCVLPTSTVTLPATCSSDRGWCGMGPPSRKYKPLSVCCLDDGACGGSGAPGFRHVPHPPTFNRHSLYCVPRDSACSVWPNDRYGAARWHGQRHTLKQLRKRRTMGFGFSQQFLSGRFLLQCSHCMATALHQRAEHGVSRGGGGRVPPGSGMEPLERTHHGSCGPGLF